MIQNKKIAIFGFGIEGASAYKYLKENNRIDIYDDKSTIDSQFLSLVDKTKVKLHLGTFPEKPQKYDLVIKSAGIRPDNKNVMKLLSTGAKLTTPTEIFFQDCPSRIIGITGTKGKGTTSTLIYELLRSQLKDVFLAGNIGTPMLEIMPKLNKNSTVVLELSSFQLMNLKKSPNYSVVLMITSEHLDWHKNVHEYIEAKKSIVKFQTEKDFAIINKDFLVSQAFSKETKAKILYFSTKVNTNAVYVKNNKITSVIFEKEEIISTNEITLPGKHNLQNICAAISVAKLFNIDNKKIKEVVAKFKGLKHRLQLVRIINGVRYYNDSFSTTPETTVAAIESFKQPKILILGGSSKKSNFNQMSKVVATSESIKNIILIGEEGSVIKSELIKNNLDISKIQEGAKNMKEIVYLCHKLAEKGDIVILSPACASFGMFTNYKDRGDQFIKEVNNL